MPSAVVTGGAGFLGSHLCEYLLAEGYRVICVDNLETGSLSNVEHIRDDAFTFVNHDVIEHIEVDEPVDVVYHLAALASPIDYMRQPLHSLKTGSYGTHNALGLAKWKRARFLLASSSEVYGDPQVHPQPETYWGHVNPIGPRGVYDEAKRYAEALTMAYHRQQGVDTSIARIHNTYGPRMRPYDGRAIPTFVRQAVENKPLTVFGDGSQTRSFCYVDDLIKALYLLATSTEHLPVNLGNPASSRFSSWRKRSSSSRGRRARSSSRRCPSTTLRCASPTSPAPCRCSAGSPRSSSRKGFGECCPLWSLFVRKQLIAAAVVALLAGLAAPSAKPSRGLIVGIFDEQATIGDPTGRFRSTTSSASRRSASICTGEARPASLASGVPRTRSIPQTRRTTGRCTTRWSSAPRRTGSRSSSRSSGRPAGPARRKEPGAAPDARPAELRLRGGQALQRHASGRRPTGRRCRPCGMWLAWNEPNNPVFLKPQYVKIGPASIGITSPAIYAKMCNAICSGVHLTGSPVRRSPAARPPRAATTGRTLPGPSLSPALLPPRHEEGAHEGSTPTRTTPITSSPNEPPNKPPPGSRAVTLGNINELIRELTRLYGNKRLWITEYGYQTNPPDRLFGVSFAKQASYLKQAFAVARKNPRIDMMIWFLIKDESRIPNGWQSGLYTASGRRKPSWLAFKRMPK